MVSSNFDKIEMIVSSFLEAPRCELPGRLGGEYGATTKII